MYVHFILQLYIFFSKKWNIISLTIIPCPGVYSFTRIWFGTLSPNTPNWLTLWQQSSSHYKNIIWILNTQISFTLSNWSTSSHTITKYHSCSPWPQKNVHKLVWKDQQSFFPALFSYNYSFCSFIIELQYNPYDIKLYTILHIKSSNPNLEVTWMLYIF